MSLVEEHSCTANQGCISFTGLLDPPDGWTWSTVWQMDKNRACDEDGVITHHTHIAFVLLCNRELATCVFLPRMGVLYWPWGDSLAGIWEKCSLPPSQALGEDLQEDGEGILLSFFLNQQMASCTCTIALSAQLPFYPLFPVTIVCVG